MCPHTPPCPAPSAPDREAAPLAATRAGLEPALQWRRDLRRHRGAAPDGAFIAPQPTDLAAFDRPVGVAPGHGGQARAIILSGIWLAAGVVAYLIWARVVRTWPFGPKLVREVYLDQQKQQLAAAGPPPQPQ